MSDPVRAADSHSTVSSIPAAKSTSATVPIGTLPCPLWPLRIALALRGIGLGASYLWHEMERESNIFGTLLFEWTYPESFAQQFEDVGMWIASIASVLILPLGIKSLNTRSGFRWLETLLLVLIVVWELTLASANTYRGGALFSQLAFGSQGLRIGVPLALLLMNLTRRVNRVEWTLRIATSATFLVHGLKALYQSPTFTTMVLGTGYHLGIELEQSLAESTLLVIGVVDMVVAMLILGARWKWLAFYMAAWGLITACARTSGSTWSSYPETLMRLVHAGGPWWLFLEWRRQSSMEASVSEPNHE